MQHHRSTLIFAILCWLTPGLTFATVCYVDPTGTNPAAYLDAQSALSGLCDNSNGPDTLIFECPAGTGSCEHKSLQILNRPLAIHFALGDPTVFGGLTGSAIEIHSSQVEIDGVFKASAPSGAGIEVVDSVLKLTSPPATRATLIGNTSAALAVFGASIVDLERAELRDSAIGLHAIPGCSGSPIVTGRELSITSNQQAGLQEDVPGACPGNPPAQISIEIGTGLQPNYVEGNENGFETWGEALLTLEHTIFLSNFRSNPAGVALLRAHDKSRITTAQILAYDNDAWSDPGQDVHVWAPVTQSSIAWASDDAEIEFRSSTLAHNQIDASLRTDGNSLIRFLSSINYQSGDLGVSAQGRFITSGSSTVFGSGNVNYDCPCCFAMTPGCTPHPDLFEDDPIPNLAFVPGYSPWPALPTDLYLMLNVQELGPGTASPTLYPSIPWSVDGWTPDVLGSPTDWGYHNPCPTC